MDKNEFRYEVYTTLVEEYGVDSDQAAVLVDNMDLRGFVFEGFDDVLEYADRLFKKL